MSVFSNPIVVALGIFLLVALAAAFIGWVVVQLWPGESPYKNVVLGTLGAIVVVVLIILLYRGVTGHLA